MPIKVQFLKGKMFLFAKADSPRRTALWRHSVWKFLCLANKSRSSLLFGRHRRLVLPIKGFLKVRKFFSFPRESQPFARLWSWSLIFLIALFAGHKVESMRRAQYFLCLFHIRWPQWCTINCLSSIFQLL